MLLGIKVHIELDYHILQMFFIINPYSMLILQPKDIFLALFCNYRHMKELSASLTLF